jgi:hypothetical protein
VVRQYNWEARAESLSRSDVLIVPMMLDCVDAIVIELARRPPGVQEVTIAKNLQCEPGGSGSLLLCANLRARPTPDLVSATSEP